VDYSNLLDLLRVKTRVCSYNLQHLFEFSFTSYFGEIHWTQKNPECV
jgi:hypothetical protein